MDRGEQCDDGNQVTADTCPNDCLYTAGKSAIRGNRHNPFKDKSGCQVEWYVVNPGAALDHFHRPNSEQKCKDGESTCDFSGGVDGLCRFKVVTCVNNDDKGLPSCKPKGLSSLTVVGPRPDQAGLDTVRNVLATDLATVQNAFIHLHDPLDLLTGYTHGPPIPQANKNLCSAPFNIDVLLAGMPRRSVSIKTLSDDGTFRPNVSRLKLTCHVP